MRVLTAILFAWFAAILAAPAVVAALPAGQPGALVQADGVPSACHAEASAGESLDSIVAQASRWRCDGGEPALGAQVALLAFPVDRGALPPAFFASRPVQFGTLTLAVVRDGKVVARHRYSPDTLTVGAQGRRFLAPIPDHAGTADVIVAAIEQPTSRGIFGDARLHSADPLTSRGELGKLLIAALVCGMLAMPLVFNAAYYRVLREKFLLWHLSVTASMLVQCLLTSGILGHFFDMSISVFVRLSILSFCVGVASAAAFCAAFIEPDKLHPRLRWALYASAVQVVAVALFHAFAPEAFRAVQNTIYYLSYLPVLLVFIAVLIDATRRGSVAVRYQIVAWSPFILMGVIRIVTMLVPWLQDNEAIGLFYAAMVVQSVATSLGVADRFMVIRRQRDRAVIRAHSLERLSERDALTGLYNRRALDGMLGDFAMQNFTGFALFDLDHFKRVNDTHGHATGDAVLRTFANVLGAHDHAVAVRMGGEEFLLLLRGENVQERVERLREAIPVRIAREVAELEVLVTASAGLVEAPPHGTIGNDFVALYRAADDLLYEAKHNGRNLLAAITLPAGADAERAVVAAV